MAAKRPIITLTTDFGHKDPFVGSMKGVILSIHPDVLIVDLTHEIERHNIEEALYMVEYAHVNFPEDTIHVVVIDPGVGTKRRPLLVEDENYLFLAPDNGVLSFLYDDHPDCTIRVIESTQYFKTPVSQTFHGRDIFAPVAAWLAKGIRPDQVGPEINDYTRLNIPQLLISEKGIRGEIIYIDRFGNLITNIQRKHLDSIKRGLTLVAESKGKHIQGIFSSYAANNTDHAGMIINSFDLLEIFCYKESAQEKLGLTRGDRIKIFPE